MSSSNAPFEEKTLLRRGSKRTAGTVCLSHSVIMQRPKVIFDKSYLLCQPQKCTALNQIEPQQGDTSGCSQTLDSGPVWLLHRL